MPAIIKLKGTKVSWVNVSQAREEELAALKKNYKFLDLDLKECPPPLQRPKLVERPNYLFLILVFPFFDRATRQIRLSEIDFFITRQTVVMVHDQRLEPLKKLFARAQKEKRLSAGLLNGSPTKLLYRLLDELLDSLFPILAHIGQDIDLVENKMTEVHDRRTIHEIFRIKSNLVGFKKSMQPHKTVIRKLIATISRFGEVSNLLTYFQNLVEHTKEIWDTLENYSSTLTAIEDTHLSLLTFRTNDIIRTLTIFAVIVFPLTLFAAIFGMNTIHTPIVGQEADFWIILGLMASSTGVMLAYFKSKRWL